MALTKLLANYDCVNMLEEIKTNTVLLPYGHGQTLFFYFLTAFCFFDTLWSRNIYHYGPESLIPGVPKDRTLIKQQISKTTMHDGHFETYLERKNLGNYFNTKQSVTHLYMNPRLTKLFFCNTPNQ